MFNNLNSEILPQKLPKPPHKETLWVSSKCNIWNKEKKNKLGNEIVTYI
jgi:hypothetical protein